MKLTKFFSLILTLLVFLSSHLSATVYEDAEDGNTAGWRVYDASPAGAQISNVYDNTRGSNVIQLQGGGTDNGYILGNWEGSAGAWADTSGTTIKWSMKYSQNFTIYIRVMTTNGARYIYYRATDSDAGLSTSSSNTVYIGLGLGASASNGTWQTFTRDLQADLAQFEPANSITEINAFLIRGSGLVDDIEVVGTPSNSTYQCANPKEFENVYKANVAGNLKLIGNTNICKQNSAGVCIDPDETANNNIVAQYKDGDTLTSTFNSSSAKLELPENAEILWAGLYWQGYFEKATLPGNLLTDTMRDKSKTMKLGYSGDGVSPPNTSPTYETITADEFNWVYFSDSRWYYQGFSEVTDFVKQNDKGWYWGADLNLQVGTKVGGGSLGAWSIAIAYKDNSDTVKNLTVYHGYLAFAGSNDVYNARNYASANGCDTTFTGVQSDSTIHLSGFRTPSSGQIDSRFIFFGGEGDIGLTGDGMSMTDKDGVAYTFSDAANPATNSLNSSISDFGVHRGATLLYPRYGYNTIGIDIDTYDTSGDGSIGNYLNHEQTSTDVRLYTSGDGYFPGGFGLATQLYVPELCYDYSVRLGDTIAVNSQNRDVNISKWGDLPLVTKVFIRSMEADFDLINTRLKIDFSPSGKFSYKNDAQFTPSVSPPNINAYFDAIETNTSQISIGKDNSITGGTIGTNETTYAKIGFDFLTSDPIDAHFDIEVQTAIQFDPTPGAPSTPFTMSTSGVANSSSTIVRCPKNPVYDPIYASFNVERDTSTFAQNEAERFPLYTQVTGRDFNVSIASYGGENYNTPTMIDTTVELELIDSGGFENNSSTGYDSICEEPDAIGGDGTLIHFDNTDRVQVDLKNTLTHFKNDLALRNAAFRLWILTKKDENSSKRVMLTHSYTDKNNENNFKTLYETHYKDAEDASIGLCATACGSTPNGCYTCLKEYFAIPICSRDNFAIRPEAFRIAISDNNETNNTNAIELTTNNSTLVNNTLSLAAGYSYKVDVNATRFKNDAIAKGYYNNNFKAESNLTDSELNRRNIVALEFNDNTACAETTHRSYAFRMENAQLDNHSMLIHGNVGDYKLWMQDTNWTQVDQASYSNKVTFNAACKANPNLAGCNDCVLTNNNSQISGTLKVGCVIHSNMTDNDSFIDVPLTFTPYSFQTNDINFTTQPSTGKPYVFMSDFAHSYYDDSTLHPIKTATSFIGSLSAMNKQGKVTTNFTQGCVAKDVTLHINRTSNPTENSIVDSAGNSVAFQQYLQESNRSIDPIASHTENAEENLTLSASAFHDAYEGSANLRLHTNFKKPLNTKVNPVEMHYKQLLAYSTAANSSAHMTTHTPEGSNDYDNNISYYFAKVTPEQTYYPAVTDNYKLTPIYVDIFCDLGADCNTSFGLTTASKGKDDTLDWYAATMFDAATDGTTDLEASNFSGVAATESVSPNDDVRFSDPDASRNDVNVSISGSGRPTVVKVKISPVPWLLFDETDPDGEPSYKVKFIGASEWLGVGKTGNTAELGSSTNTNSRINW